LISVSLEVPEALLPSMIFCFPERSLNHLVNCAVPFFQKPLTESHRALENHERFMVSEQAGVAAVRRNESFARMV